MQADGIKPNLDLSSLVLVAGGHDSFEKGACVMEAVSMLAGETWSDHPQCACPIISAFLRSWNDRLSDERRQELKQYIPDLVGSKASLEIERQRTWMITDWVVRECAPIWLRRAGMNDKAEIMASFAPIHDHDSFQSIRPAILAIRDETDPIRYLWRQRIREAVQKALTEKKSAAAAAVSVSAAEAAAAAAAAAVSVSVSAVVSVSAAADDAAADAAAAADAVSVAAAEAAAWSSNYDRVYKVVRAKVEAIYREKIGPTQDESRASAHALVRRLLALK